MADAGATVRIYSSPACDGAVRGTGVASGGGTFSVSVAVLDDTTTTFYATAADDDGAVESACSTTSHTYVEDSTPPSAPEVTATSPWSPANDNAPQVSGAAEPGSTVKLFDNAACDGAPIVGGLAADFETSGLAIFVVNNSATVIHANATDAARNVSSCSIAPFTYVEDSAAPTTFIDSGPAAVANETDATFVLSASEAAVTFGCNLDGAGFEGCATPVTYSDLTPGAHTFVARAIDSAGNVGSPSATAAWEIDFTTPQTAIDSTPANSSNSDAATFTFSSSEPGATFLCSLDGDTPVACTSPKTYTGLGGSSHVFTVRAIDPFGNADPSAAFYTWNIDTVNPQTTITSGPNGSSEPRVTFTFSASESPATFECRLDRGPRLDCTSPQTYANLSNGTHRFRVRAIDAAGNRDPSAGFLKWTVTGSVALDTKAPGRVKSMRAYGGVNKITITWTLPDAEDFAYVEVLRQRLLSSTADRAQTGEAGPIKVVYRGARRVFVDRKVRDGRRYRYTIVAVDRAGNRSAARKRAAFPTPLFRLATGTQVSRRPVLRWTAVEGATFYNIQIFWKGQKVLSAWPTRARFRMPQRWTFEGKERRFNRPGRLDWFVFPATENGGEVRFGKLLGHKYFFVKRRSQSGGSEPAS